MPGDGGAGAISIRPARADDLPAIQRIYNREILEGVATWDEWPWSMERRRAWLEQHRDEVVLVAVGERSVVGFAYLSPHRGKFGYRFTRECTCYVDQAQQRRGIGRRLIEALIEEARGRRLHSLIALVEASNEASLRLAESLGFERVGHERETGYKHGRWLDVVELQLRLQPAAELEAAVAPGFRIVTVTSAAEMEEALAVRRAVFIEEQGVPEDEEIDRYDGDPAQTEDALHVLGRLDGRPVATARLLLDYGPGEHPHIGRVAVLRELRSRYYGVAIMDALHEQARRRGHAGVTLAAQEWALGFYERLRYIPRGEIFLDAGIEHRWMDLTFEADG